MLPIIYTIRSFVNQGCVLRAGAMVRLSVCHYIGILSVFVLNRMRQGRNVCLFLVMYLTSKWGWIFQAVSILSTLGWCDCVTAVSILQTMLHTSLMELIIHYDSPIWYASLIAPGYHINPLVFQTWNNSLDLFQWNPHESLFMCFNVVTYR